MKNPKFLKIFIDPKSGEFVNYEYLKPLADLLFKNKNQLFDDWFNFNKTAKISKTIELIKRYQPYFWLILHPLTNELAGVVYLYDVIGKPPNVVSVTVSACFERKFWGSFVQRCARLFFRHIFAKIKPRKVFAQVYCENILPRSLLLKNGFVLFSVDPCGVARNGTFAPIATLVKFREKSDLAIYLEGLNRLATSISSIN